MQSLGNDFILVDALEKPWTLMREAIATIAHRQYGIGFDQLLLLEPPEQPECDAHFRIFNADGSEAEQCGNGARAVALWMRDRKGAREVVRFSMIQGRRLECYLLRDNQVAVSFSPPIFLPSEAPMLGAVNLGNPHAVFLVDHWPLLGMDKEKIKWANQQPQFPNGVNVGFMQILNSSHIRLQVIERGSGLTLACGSGACA
ncbi:MAG TPA: diaminopimelate epimerase, partial [Coxiellaceae bacterium]|nr:diaminopimelate epimerase [Coxiellaceae bacterium]